MSYNSTVGPKDSQTLNQKIADLSGATSGYASTTYVNNAVSGKQDTLVDSGANQNIKTINGQSILGSGNINAGGKIMLPADVFLFSEGNNHNDVSGFNSTVQSALTNIYNSYSANPENALGELMIGYSNNDGDTTYALCGAARLSSGTVEFEFYFKTSPSQDANWDEYRCILLLSMSDNTLDGYSEFQSSTIY